MDKESNKVMVGHAKKNNFIKFLSALAMTCLVMGVLMGPSLAQEGSAGNAPPLPKPLQTMADEGAQIRYMGREYGMDAWLAIQRGREQFFYVTGKGDAMVMGLLFDTETGRLVTIDQVQKVQQESGGVLDLFAAQRPEPELQTSVLGKEELAIKPSSERLMEDIESSNFLAFGDEKAPVIYAFIDPQCPYCHAFVQDLRANYLPNGLVQLRMIPVGFREDSKAQAAFLLGAPDAQARFLRHLDGDKEALPVSYDINQQGVERNMAIMQGWKLNVTPLIIYRAGSGEVKIVQGRARDVAKLVADLKK